MSSTRRSFIAALGTGAATAAAGCLGSPSSDSSDAGSVDLLLNWKPNGLHVPYYAAKSQGFYEEEGLTVSNIESGQGSDFAAKQAGLGNTDLAVTSSDQVLLTNGGELSVTSVGVVMQQSPNVIFSTRDSFGAELTDPEQLAGKSIGSGPGMVRILAELYLEAVGVLQDVELVDTGYDTVQRLLAGEVDAAAGVFGDAIDARFQDATVDTLNVASEVPSYGHVLATSPGFAEDNSDAVSAFLKGTARGAVWGQQNPEAAVDALVEQNSGLSEVREQQRESWETLASGYMTGPAVEENGWGWSNAEPWTTVADALASTDSVGSPSDPADAWTNDYLDTDYEYIGDYANLVE